MEETMSRSSKLWKKSDKSGIFGGDHKTGLWKSSQDTPGPGTQEDHHYWDKLEEELNAHNEKYSESYPVEPQHKYEDLTPPHDYQTDNYTPEQAQGFQEEENYGQRTEAEAKAKPYREEKLKVTDIRRGGHKKIKNHMSKRFAKHSRGGEKIPPDTKPVDCPECGQISFRSCLECPKRNIWDDRGEGPMCPHEYEERKNRGDYDYIMDDPPSDEDMEKYYQSVEEEKLRFEKEEMPKRREETRQALSEFFKLNYGTLNFKDLNGETYKDEETGYDDSENNRYSDDDDEEDDY